MAETEASDPLHAFEQALLAYLQTHGLHPQGPTTVTIHYHPEVGIEDVATAWLVDRG